MTLLEKPKVLDGLEVPSRRRFEWTIWVVLAFLIVAGVTAAILLNVEEGVPADEAGAALALDNYVAANRIVATEQATRSDLALELTSIRVMEDRFPGRMEMLETSAQRADEALGYGIERVLGG